MINKLIHLGCSACSINPYGCNTCAYFSTYGTSKARWCCGGDPGAEYDRYASFFVPNTLNVSAGDAIPFSAAILTGAFSYNAENQLVILQPGVYKAFYTLNIPASAAVDTTLSLQLNGSTLAGSQVSVVHSDSDGSVTIAGQALFEAAYATTLELVTESALVLSGANPGDVLATLIVSTL